MFEREREMRPAVSSWVEGLGFMPVFETSISHIVDILGVRFCRRVGREVPAFDRVIAVELKLSDISGVLFQCRNNRAIVDESWAAMPEATVSRMRPKSLEAFSSNGIGLLAVSDVVRVVMPAIRADAETAWLGKRQLVHRRMWRYLRKQVVAVERGSAESHRNAAKDPEKRIRGRV